MKHCPKCAYDNADSAGKCEVCQGSLTGVASIAIQVPEKSGLQAWSFLFSGILLLACGAYFIRAPLPVPKAPQSVFREGNFTYEGVLYSLEKMKQLRFLPLADRRSVAELLYSQDEQTGFAAAELVGAWSRFSAVPGECSEFFTALLKAAGASHGAARRQAAMEAGLSAAYGFPFSVYVPEMRKTAAGLMKENDETLNSAGFFLASMSGFTDFAPELNKVLASSPSPYLKLHAACALSRLGGAAGHKYLFSMVSSEAELRGEAISCLSYSVSPEAGPFLEKAVAGKLGRQAAAPAKIALTLRKQLAIINR